MLQSDRIFSFNFTKVAESYFSVIKEIAFLHRSHELNVAPIS